MDSELKSFINKNYAEYRMSLRATSDSGMLHDPEDIFSFLNDHHLMLNKMIVDSVSNVSSQIKDLQDFFKKLTNDDYNQLVLDKLNDFLFNILPEEAKKLSNDLANKKEIASSFVPPFKVEL